VKTPDKNPKAGAAKQKKQLLVLTGLSAVFAAVLAIQFSGDGKETFEVAALAEPATTSPEGGTESESEAPAVAVPVAKDNPVLSKPTSDVPPARSPFSNFWNVAPTGTTTEGMPALAAPSITVNATMPSETSGLAIIDGELRITGDMIQGWQLAEVHPRSVMLRAASGETVVVNMPLLAGGFAEPRSAALRQDG
jgi:hypothetical protein